MTGWRCQLLPPAESRTIHLNLLLSCVHGLVGSNSHHPARISQSTTEDVHDQINIIISGIPARLQTVTSHGQHQYPFTDCPVPSTHDRNGRNRPSQVESPKLCLRPDMTLAGSKSRPQPHLIPSVPARTRASPRPGTPRRGIAAMSGRRAFQCIPSVRGRQRQSGAAKRLTRAAGSSPKEHTPSPTPWKIPSPFPTLTS